MILRSHFFLSFTAAVALMVAALDSSLVAGTSDQPAVEAAKDINKETPAITGESTPAEKGKAVPVVKEIEAPAPFLLLGSFDEYPATSVETVRIFDGEKAFGKYVDEGNLTVWPIAEFKSAVWPKNEKDFRDVLRNNAAEIGADYVVVYTHPAEIKRIFQWRLQEQFYCAHAFKRVKARLGIERDHAVTKKNVSKVSGFLPGSRAEESGLRVGDIIKTVDGEVPGGDDQYWAKALRWKVGEKVKVEVERDGKTVELDVILSAG